MGMELGREVKEGKRERKKTEKGKRGKGTPLNSPRTLVFPHKGHRVQVVGTWLPVIAQVLCRNRRQWKQQTLRTYKRNCKCLK